MLKKCKNLFLSKNGQTLIETVVTIGVVVVIISSLVLLVVGSTRRSTLSRQADQATKLAQEGMEYARAIRDQDNVVKVGEKLDPNFSVVSCAVSPFCTFADLFTADQNSILTCLSDLKNELVADTASDCESSGSKYLSSIFKRRVRIEDFSDFSSNECKRWNRSKKVVVTVEWESTLGMQTREAETCLRILPS